jgi:hypothetical protein
MHGPDPNDLLAPGMDGDRACLQCHEPLAADPGAHTHHAPGSSGSACMNCHMPHTTYGLLKAIRSHEIDSPSVQSSLETGRPNACSLCHLDRTLEWAASHLESWYGIPAPTTLTEDQRRIAAGVLWAVTGHANQRALIAWHMGWGPAAEASGSTWFGLYLAHLLCDPYPAVRFIAIRSLRRQPEFRDIEYDFVGSTDHLAAVRSTVMKRWRDRLRRLRAGAALLINADGTLELDLLERLSASRDDTVMDLRE